MAESQHYETEHETVWDTRKKGRQKLLETSQSLKGEFLDAVRDSGFVLQKQLESRSFFSLSGFQKPKRKTTSEWFENRLRVASEMINSEIEIDSEKRNGIPVLRGTRISLAQIFAELADGFAASEIADDFSLKKNKIENVLKALSIYLDTPFEK